MKLVYTIDAVEDLARLREFIETHDPDAANRVSKGLINGLVSLNDNPGIGRRVEKAPDPDMVRDLVIGHYVVRYLIHKETIVILRIWHQKEDRKSFGE